MFIRAAIIRLCLLTLAMMSFAPSGFAGYLFSIGPNWNNFVFEAETDENTPNYYGYGGRLSWGYSIGQVFDLGMYAQYTPGRTTSPSMLNGDAAVYDYGGELGVRVLGVFYIGARGGAWKYQLYKRQQMAEIGGIWSGWGGSGSLGMILPVSKRASWQTSFDMGRAIVEKDNKTLADLGTRYKKLSKLSITMAFVYNDFDAASAGTSLINSFYDSLF